MWQGQRQGQRGGRRRREQIWGRWLSITVLLAVPPGLAACQCGEKLGFFNQVRVTVNGAGTGGGRVRPARPVESDTFNLDCTFPSATPCSDSFRDAGEGGTVYLEAVPNADSVFRGWTGCSREADGQCLLTFEVGPEVKFEVTARFDLASPDGGPPDGAAPDLPLPPPDGPTCSNVAQPATAAAYPNLGQVCNPKAVLVKDGVVTGLGRKPTDTGIYIGTRYLTACVNVDFEAEYNALEAHVTIRAVPETCGASCYPDACGTGHTVGLYGSTDGTTFAYVGSAEISGTLEVHTVKLSGGRLRHLLVCRGGWGYGRDHLEVDHVQLCQ